MSPTLSHDEEYTLPTSPDEHIGVEHIESILVLKGWKAYDQQDYTTSKAIAETCLTVAEKRPSQVLSLLGASLLRLGDQANARTCIEEISSRFPDFVIGKLLRAECALLDGRSREAETDALQVLKAIPPEGITVDYALNILAQAWELDGPAEPQTVALNELYAVYGNNPAFLAQLARIQYKLGRFAEARQNLGKALEKDHNNEPATRLREEWSMTEEWDITNDPMSNNVTDTGEGVRAVDTSPAGQLNRSVIPPRPDELRTVSLPNLGSELLARIRDGSFTASEESILLGYEIQEALRAALDVHNNRWSERRYRDLFDNFYGCLEPPRPTLEGATIVELGCGSHNPYGMLFLFLMLGARKGFAIDLDEIQNVPRAVRALADLAAMMLINPAEIVGDHAPIGEQLLQNIASFDLSRLHAGDLTGLDSKRLAYRRESAQSLSLADGEADLVISNSFFEHLPCVEDVITEMARILRSGGIGIHNIDGSDHRRYGDPDCHPLEFLTEAVNEPLVYGCNRIRPVEFVSLFKRHGFEVISFIPYEIVEITQGLRERLVGPFRSMTNDNLSVFTAKIVVRRL